MTVPTPTNMASYLRLSPLARALSSSDEIVTCFLSTPAILPSADMAQFTCTNGFISEPPESP